MSIFFKPLILLTFFCQSSFARPVQLALSSAPRTLNPLFATDANSQNINRLLHSSLVDFSENMQFQCVACESFKEVYKKNGEYHLYFKMKSNLKFWDGSPLIAQDVAESWRIFTEEKEIKSIFRFAFKKILDVEVKGDDEVILKYASYSPSHLSDLALFKLIRLAKKEKTTPHYINFGNYSLMGSGSYKLLSQAPLEIHIAPLAVNNGRELIFKTVRDETTLALKLIKGEIDLALGGMSERKIHWALNKKGNHSLQKWSRPGTNYVYLNINHRKWPLSDLRFRKVLDLITPKEDLIKYKLKGEAALSNGLFSKAFKKYYSPPLLRQGLSDRYKRANTLMLELGFKKNIKGLWVKGGHVLNLNWPSSNNKKTLENTWAISNEWKKFGIESTIRPMEWGSFRRYFKQGRYDVILSQWVGFTGPDMLNFVFSSDSFPPKGANRGHFSNPSIDQALLMAQKAVTEDQRVHYYKKALSITRKKLPYIDLWHPKVTWVGNDCISLDFIYPNGNFKALETLQTKGCFK